MAMKLVIVKTPQGALGLTLDNGKVVDAAPRLKFMVGWGQQQVFDYCDAQGWITSMSLVTQ